MQEEFEQRWQKALVYFESKFGEDLDLDACIFLIGIQELGHGFKPFTKDEKLDVMHIAVCRLLEPFGFYEYTGRDEEGWPHFKRNEKLPNLKADEQERLMKEAIINYTLEQQSLFE